MRKILIPLLFLSVAGHAKSREIIRVRVENHASQVNQRHATYVTPGSSTTNCTGSATTLGNTTTGDASCRTTSVPSQTRNIDMSTLEVRNVVVSPDKKLRYVIVCRASWSGSNCGPLPDGEMFIGEVEGTTMWIEARKGGNQGKKISIKYKILDIRPSEPPPQPK